MLVKSSLNSLSQTLCSLPYQLLNLTYPAIKRKSSRKEKGSLFLQTFNTFQLILLFDFYKVAAQLHSFFAQLSLTIPIENSTVCFPHCTHCVYIKNVFYLFLFLDCHNWQKWPGSSRVIHFVWKASLFLFFPKLINTMR